MAHTTANATALDAGQLRDKIVEEKEEINEEEVTHPLAGLVATNIAAAGGDGAFARLRPAGLL